MCMSLISIKDEVVNSYIANILRPMTFMIQVCRPELR